ncbi:conserved protein of unknown function [Acidithiobacillus ferrivorans]|jgi:hypothetical protein|uniref:Uncharacterized protein n=1 Tax=Acidithiobacillus ferrivorans TaxID=160808 RepID=A0A060V0H7_9PROT|nr:hypothetical protein [Acidithiobacillus ferrivorans]MBN6741612.1 hypothetical protein [Acidithiobacillus sp. MC6.1]OCB02051.1 hypothetical protein BBC27_14925 [Acidithiobacillus ferrivorans]QQD73833.1 hypothetical protein H2515_06245 [Acidithiobacillus ferrivorans]CDQ12378.1 conserved hypothetical protein [Acidithiobacillus ferrivorans]SMH65080.1 conserved protein of unknown function [Acidithiobacillus ferrivorans]
MFAIKALFSDENAVREGFSGIRKALMENHPDRLDYYDVLRKILQQQIHLKHAVFAEKDVVSCEFYGFDERESAMAEAALLDVGALEIIVE